MLNFKIIRKVQIPTIDEEFIIEVLKEAIQKQLPEDVNIDNIRLVMKRSGTHQVNAEVDASFVDAPEISSVAVPAPAVEQAPAPVQAPVQEAELKVEAPTAPAATKPAETSLIDEVLAETQDEDVALTPPSSKAPAVNMSGGDIENLFTPQ